MNLRNPKKTKTEYKWKDKEEITHLNAARNQSRLFKPPKATPRYEYNIKKTHGQPQGRYIVRKNSPTNYIQ